MKFQSALQNFQPKLAAAAVLLVGALLVFAQPTFAQTKIVATVNDEPISEFDVDQRTDFYYLTSGGKANKGELRKRSMEELVEEALMAQEMRRMGIDVPDTEVVSAIDERLRPNKRDHAWFKGMLRSRGVRIATLENRIRSQIGWRQVVQRTYSSLIDIGENEITQAIEEIDAAENQAESVFNLKKIVLLMPEDAPEAELSQRMEDASKIRRAFRDCRTSGLVTGRFRDVKIEDFPGRKIEDIEEPTRSLVLQANTNDMIPPNVTDQGIELIAVCERTDDGGKREKAERQLVSQEFSMLSDRHLRDLKQDAIVDYR